MTLDEALNSNWIGTNQKVKDLLRSGSLTFKTLRVTANRSENGHQKAIAQAVWVDYEAAHAQVFPPTSSHTYLTGLPDVKLTLEQARSTSWKGKDHSGEGIGRLLDEGFLSLRDLAWAAESNYDAKVREAARILLFQQLHAPVREPDEVGNAKVLKGGPSYSKEKVEDLFTKGSIAMGIGGGGALAVVYQRWFGANPILLLWIFGLLTASIVPWLLLKKRDIRNHLLGAEEEDLVCARLAITLDSSWRIIRNVQKKGIQGDIDLVLVGPGGVYAVEVKKWKVELRIEGDQTSFASQRARRLGYGNPVHQARKNAKALYKFLASKGLNLPVVPILVVSVPRLELVSPQVTVWKSEDISQEAIWLPSTSKSIIEIDRVAAILEG